MRWAATCLGLGVLALVACSAPAPSRPAGSATGAAAPGPASASAPSAAGTGAAPAAPEARGAAAAVQPLAPPVMLRAASLLGLTDAGLFIGMDRGYFAEEGLEIESVRVDGAAQAMPHVATGQLDLAGVTPSSAFFNAVLRGLPLRIAADKGRVRPGQAQSQWVLREDVAASGAVRDWPDLRGLTLGINVPNSGSVTDIMLDAALSRGGLTRDDVRIVELPYPDMNAALANRTIDAAMHNDPLVTLGANQGILRRWRSVAEATPDQYTGVWLYGPAFGETEAAQRFMVGYLRGARVFNDAMVHGRDRAAVVEILTRYTAVKDPALYADMSFSYVDPDGRVDPERIAADVQYYLAKGFTQQPIDVQQVIDTRYVDYALARLGPYRPPAP